MPSSSIQADTYPSWLEEWWIQRALRACGASSLSDAQRDLEQAVERLSSLFTTDRETGFGRYEKDPRLLAAYSLFYFPQTFVRIRFPLRELLLLRRWQPCGADGTVRLLDLGAGLGGATLGTALLIRDCAREFGVAQIKATAVDQSAASLAAIRQLARDQADNLRDIAVETERGDLRSWFRKHTAGEQWDLIVASFSLGEAFFDADDHTVLQWIESALRQLRPGGILLITEPALRETSERIERLRNLVSEQRLARIWAPCPHHRACPLLADGKYWCHAVRRWNTPDSLSFLNRRLYRSVQDLKFSYLAAGTEPAPGASPDAADPRRMRLITPFSRLKGRYVWGGCAADGLRYDWELQRRDVPRADQAAIEKIERGDMLDVSGGEVLGSPRRRRAKAVSDLQSWSQRDGGADAGSAWESP